MSDRWRGCLLEVIETLILTLIIFFVIQHFVAQPYQILQRSMEPTLEPGQYVLVDKLSPNFVDYKRGDVIVFSPPAGFQEDGQDVPFIKRVIGLPGDVVELRDGAVYVNGARLNEPYVYQGQATTPVAQGGGLTRWVVPHGYLFVLGDHRAESQDSRAFGPIARSTVIGRAWIRYWPLSTLTFVGSATYSGVPDHPSAELLEASPPTATPVFGQQGRRAQPDLARLEAVMASAEPLPPGRIEVDHQPAHPPLIQAGAPGSGPGPDVPAFAPHVDRQDRCPGEGDRTAGGRLSLPPAGQGGQVGPGFTDAGRLPARPGHGADAVVAEVEEAYRIPRSHHAAVGQVDQGAPVAAQPQTQDAVRANGPDTKAAPVDLLGQGQDRVEQPRRDSSGSSVGPVRPAGRAGLRGGLEEAPRHRRPVQSVSLGS
jgi:signal peptidase I